MKWHFTILVYLHYLPFSLLSLILILIVFGAMKYGEVNSMLNSFISPETPSISDGWHIVADSLRTNEFMAFRIVSDDSLPVISLLCFSFSDILCFVASTKNILISIYQRTFKNVSELYSVSYIVHL